MLTYQDNVNRAIRTEEYALKHMNYKGALRDPIFSCRTDIVYTSLYCFCKDCIKFCCYNKPIRCIDPYLMDIRFTHWIYAGLVVANETANTRDPPVRTASTDEPVVKRRKI